MPIISQQGQCTETSQPMVKFQVEIREIVTGYDFLAGFLFEALMIASAGTETSSNQERLSATNREVRSFTNGPEKLTLADVSPTVKFPCQLL